MGHISAAALSLIYYTSLLAGCPKNEKNPFDTSQLDNGTKGGRRGYISVYYGFFGVDSHLYASLNFGHMRFFSDRN